MPCNCDSRLDSIMKFLEEVRTEIGTVKTKCIRIEKEILGITAESEANADALMETTTVRHLVEKVAFDVNKLAEENKKARAEAKQQKKIQAATKDLHAKFSEAMKRAIKELKTKYNVVALKTLETQFSKVLEECRCQAEKVLLGRGFSTSVLHDLMEGVTRTTDLDGLYKLHFADKNKEMESVIREQHGEVVEMYAKRAITKMEDFHDIGLDVIYLFLNKFKLCAVAYTGFQKELLNEFPQINEHIEANRTLLERLTQDYQKHAWSEDSVRVPGRRLELEDTLKKEITASDYKLVPLFLNKLRQNMGEIDNARMGSVRNGVGITDFADRLFPALGEA